MVFFNFIPGKFFLSVNKKMNSEQVIKYGVIGFISIIVIFALIFVFLVSFTSNIVAKSNTNIITPYTPSTPSNSTLELPTPYSSPSPTFINTTLSPPQQEKPYTTIPITKATSVKNVGGNITSPAVILDLGIHKAYNNYLKANPNVVLEQFVEGLTTTKPETWVREYYKKLVQANKQYLSGIKPILKYPGS